MTVDSTAAGTDAAGFAGLPRAKNQKVLIKSYGCQMNVYDAARMADSLGVEGYSETKDAGEADLVILNTCHIRERASEKVYSELGRMNEIKEARAAKGLSTVLAVAGCVAQAEGPELIRRQPAVDFVIGTQSYHQLPEALKRAAGGPAFVMTDFDTGDKFQQLVPPVAEKIKSRGVTAFVTVQEGCDKFCAFCVVPYTRGVELSRPARQIVEEVERLANAGVRDVTLLGQNVNAWNGGAGGPRAGLPGLFEKIAGVPGISRIRYMTSHPCDMDDGLIEAHRDMPALMPYLHLPVQSGSDRVLKAMNRKHRAADYVKIIERVRRARPDIAISSDFIVGFPGETQSDFEDTMRLVREIGFASAYSFKYSSRPGTPAADLPGHPDEAMKSRRLLELQILLEEQRRAFNQARVGTMTEVLFEKEGRHKGQIGGKTPHMQAVHAEGPAELIGQIRLVELAELGSNSFRGRIAGGTAP